MVIFRFSTNSTLLQQYRQLLEMKVRFLVEQMLHGHTRRFFEFGYPGSVVRVENITLVISYLDTNGRPK